MLELQNFCRLYNYKLVLANGFNTVNLKNHMLEFAKPLANKFNWDYYLHRQTQYVAMIEKLIELDQAIDQKNWKDFYNKYSRFDYPQEYLTNCSHPTIKGYSTIANELNKFISQST
jgi:hypothetical protein